MPSGWVGMDVGPSTSAAFADAIGAASTIVANGPMGVFEMPRFAEGTLSVTRCMADATDAGAVSVLGGGDTVLAAKVAGVTDRLTHVSTGGGASLELLEGKLLPGISALTDV